MRPAELLSRTAGPAGLLVALLAVLSPLEAMGAHSFAAHMALHLILIIVAAPLIAPWRHGPAIPRSALARWFSSAEAAWAAAALFAVAILFWHLPAAHDWALSDPVVHWIEHLTVLGTAIAFWRLVVFAREGGPGRSVAVLLVWLVSLEGALLSAVIMFAPTQLCGSYAGNPLSDQVMAGLMMCIPASLAYCATTVWALARLFRDSERHAG